MTDQLPLERLALWVEKRPDAVWLSQPVNGQWHDFTWAQVDDQARRMATALHALGCVPGDRVALLAKNCAEWIIADLAIMLAGLISVPLYPLQSAESIDYVLRHSQCKAIFLGKLDEPAKLAPGIPAEVMRVAMPYPTIEASHGWHALLAAHQPLRDGHRQAPDELLSILYTSGTTGQPKGVMLSAKAFAIAGGRSVKELQITEQDQYFSYLPLSHAAERFLVEMNALYSGGRVAFVESLETFASDLRHVRPTVFFSVPRLWTRFQQGVLEKLPQPKLARLLGIPLIGGLVARKIRKGLGLDRARILVSGAAAIPRALLDWYQSIGITICEGYGMTEHLAYGCFNRPGQVRFGTVGRPMPGNELRIAENGEILLRCPSLMLGYYQDPEKTAETITDGWLHTGDKGEVDAAGYLKITGRVKDIFKTSKGKYIAPAPIEGEIAKNLWVEQVCLMGSNLDQPLALIELSPAAREQAREQVAADLAQTLAQLNAQLEAHERLSHFVLVREAWTVDNGCMTPTMKIRRNVLEARFADQLSELDAKQPLHWQ
ncbi:MAG: AMP-binding protein [Pseudomonas sp.]|uniref:AMP-binding protein n=1 Tax=Pseudomonas sp. TaxID=306 RepID=UPI00272670C6|nr:AMP-binding protein [Pseudomonas sp.]MDO9617238.1 AMP-binding protein [Pseudomonas sp.]MDP2444820.1 AMP-binding protein [Pseudomonas sp.]MDZ4336721.1 AMP-binding protein [Pseudomonas sp.]